MRQKLRQEAGRPSMEQHPEGRRPVSVEAISWALNLAPVPADRGGQPSSACKFVLVGLANHAGPDGAGAFPSVATLVAESEQPASAVFSLPAYNDAPMFVKPNGCHVLCRVSCAVPCGRSGRLIHCRRPSSAP